MLLDKTRAVKIADFGVARVEASNPNDMTGETGTLGYMAPEVSGLMYLITRFWLVLHNHMRNYLVSFGVSFLMCVVIGITTHYAHVVMHTTLVLHENGITGLLNPGLLDVMSVIC